MSYPTGIMAGMNVREATARIANTQFGLITRTQALAAGLSEAQIRRRARSGEWDVVRPGVYAVAGVPPTWEQAACAAVLAAQPQAWASHHTAGVLWGFSRVTASAIDILTTTPRRLRLSGVVAHRSCALFTADLTRHRGILATTPERTLVDLSASLPADRLGSILDDALRRRLIQLSRLRRCVGRLQSAPGRQPAKVHTLLAARLPGYDPGDSDLETSVLGMLAAAGLPLPEQQHRVRIGGRTFRLDLAYPEVKLAIELDGWDFHRTRTAFDDDRSRANALVVAGWTVVRFTSRTPEAEIVACVRARLASLAACGQSGVA